jgi:hypothetical protein
VIAENKHDMMSQSLIVSNSIKVRTALFQVIMQKRAVLSYFAAED